MNNILAVILCALSAYSADYCLDNGLAIIPFALTAAALVLAVSDFKV